MNKKLRILAGILFVASASVAVKTIKEIRELKKTEEIEIIEIESE